MISYLPTLHRIFGTLRLLVMFKIENQLFALFESNV